MIVGGAFNFVFHVWGVARVSFNITGALRVAWLLFPRGFDTKACTLLWFGKSGVAAGAASMAFSAGSHVLERRLPSRAQRVFGVPAPFLLHRLPGCVGSFCILARGYLPMAPAHPQYTSKMLNHGNKSYK